jgi:hypothetical protein
MNKKHLGSDLDDFLREENLLDTAEATAAKRVIAFLERAASALGPVTE